MEVTINGTYECVSISFVWYSVCFILWSLLLFPAFSFYLSHLGQPSSKHQLIPLHSKPLPYNNQLNSPLPTILSTILNLIQKDRLVTTNIVFYLLLKLKSAWQQCFKRIRGGGV